MRRALRGSITASLRRERSRQSTGHVAPRGVLVSFWRGRPAREECKEAEPHEVIDEMEKECESHHRILNVERGFTHIEKHVETRKRRREGVAGSPFGTRPVRAGRNDVLLPPQPPDASVKNIGVAHSQPGTRKYDSRRNS